MAGLGLAVSTTLLGLVMATATATADPTDPGSPPTSSSSETATPPLETTPLPVDPEPPTDPPPTSSPTAQRPLNSILGATMEFTKNTYTPDETPTVRVTLTNKDRLPLAGIVAICDSDDHYPNLTGTGDGWGALAGAGVTVPAGATRVLTVTEPMPANAADHGYVRVDCAFGQSGVDYGANPRASDQAAVPGQFADVTIEIANYGEGQLSGFRAVLTSGKDQCPVIAEATIGADGKATLEHVPAGMYHLYIVPPSTKWFFKHGNDVSAQVVANRDNVFSFAAWQQPDDNPDLASPPMCAGPGPTTTAPAPQGGTPPTLANTGASVVPLGIAGLVALLLGGGALLLDRRRGAR